MHLLPLCASMAGYRVNFNCLLCIYPFNFFIALRMSIMLSIAVVTLIYGLPYWLILDFGAASAIM